MAEPAKQTDSSPPDGLFPIRTVAHLTGVNPVTLRAWERRYNLIRPQRTPKGHRLYTRKDIDDIKRVLTLLEQGISIGQVGPLLKQAPQPQPSAPGEQPDPWQRYRERMLAAIEQFDEARLDSAYNDALSLYPVELVNSRLTTPLMQQLGERWKERPAGVAEEHFFSVYLRNKLGTRIHHMNQRSSGPRLLVACLPGEYHEIGMLFFALAAVNLGYRVVLLGANVPLEQLPAVLQQRACDAVVLSGSAKLARNLLSEALPRLVQDVDVPVLVGGLTAARHQAAIEQAGAISAGENIQHGLQSIGRVLGRGG
jgi:DNA-binding transcriptional MerR regulator/methylmalonyl-CoA mutase cobalamin-binding subunit